jgi:hypothetical protein
MYQVLVEQMLKDGDDADSDRSVSSRVLVNSSAAKMAFTSRRSAST